MCLGIYFFISLTLEIFSLASDFSLLALVTETGFFWTHGILLICLKVVTNSISKQTQKILFQYITFIIFIGHIWYSKDDLPVPFGKSKFYLLFFGILALAPVMKLISLLGFIYFWKFPNEKKQVAQKISKLYNYYIQNLQFQRKYHFFWKQQTVIDGSIYNSLMLIILTYMSLTHVLPPPW